MTDVKWTTKLSNDNAELRAEIARLNAAFASMTATCMEMTEAYDASRERLRAQLAALREAAEHECKWLELLVREEGIRDAYAAATSDSAEALRAALANTEAPTGDDRGLSTSDPRFQPRPAAEAPAMCEMPDLRRGSDEDGPVCKGRCGFPRQYCECET